MTEVYGLQKPHIKLKRTVSTNRKRWIMFLLFTACTNCKRWNFFNCLRLVQTVEQFFAYGLYKP